MEGIEAGNGAHETPGRGRGTPAFAGFISTHESHDCYFYLVEGPVGKVAE